MKNMNTMMSSNRYDWETPDELFNQLHAEFGFTIDAAADSTNAKLPRFLSVADNALFRSWKNERVWCNPPYGEGMLDWAIQFCDQSDAGSEIVALVPSRTDAQWFQMCMMVATTVTFIKGRLKFKGAKWAAPFPSALFTFGIEPANDSVLSTLGIMVRL